MSKHKKYVIELTRDETVPCLDGPGGPLENLGIDMSAFVAWLGPKLGNHRRSLELKEQMRNAKEERAFVTRMTGAINALLPMLAHVNIPPYLDIDLTLEARKKNMDWPATTDEARRNLSAMRSVLNGIQRKWSDRARAGRPTTSSRDKLLAETAKWLLPSLKKVALARSVSAQVLTACGLPIEKEETIKKAAVRGKNSL